jgi:hypothetical protein
MKSKKQRNHNDFLGKSHSCPNPLFTKPFVASVTFISLNSSAIMTVFDGQGGVAVCA